ncbi:uncharacterized protein L201_002860 [Kwoniella dendrophila CBS 6074]|uniref:Exonuclease 1 n=1 Tax=Kwoniella dendrophila CBS 6074 TaxID=1295534 RepID=A0AAX4JRL4_9TREE
MGVQGLMKWVRGTYPQAIKSYPSRWASPEFTGKKVAIDANLMTNRYHFASKNSPFEDKGPIIGWYNLITEMRAYGVIPITVWDERGVREWKAPEALKRLTTRATHLHRRNQEIRRSERLETLKEALTEFDSMREEEKDIIRAHWEIDRFMFRESREDVANDVETLEVEQVDVKDSQSSLKSHFKVPPTPHIDKIPSLSALSSSKDVPKSMNTELLPTPPATSPEHEGLRELSKQSQLSATLSEVDDGVVERVTSMIDTLVPIIQDYRESQKKSSTQGEDSDLSLALGDNESIVEIDEELREWVPTKSRFATSSIEDQKKAKALEDDEKESTMHELDSVLEELISNNQIGETKRQKYLSKEEGEIISAILSSAPSTPSVQVSAENQEDPSHISSPLSPGSVSGLGSETEEILAVEKEMQIPISDPLERLNQLLVDAPSVRQTHEKALDIPTAADQADCKELLKVMGVLVLEAKVPFEAEGLASALAKNGLVDFVGTEDSDVLAYEGPLLKGLSPQSSALELIPENKLRELTGLNRKEYLDFLILLGTDASPRIPSIGAVRALENIKKHKSIENILNKEPKILNKLLNSKSKSNPSSSLGCNKETFLKLVNNARKVFNDLPSTEQYKSMIKNLDSVNINDQIWNDQQIEQFLEEKHGIKLVEQNRSTLDY